MERQCNAFLWKGDDSAATGAKVGWDFVTLPKQEGGLGIKKPKEQNVACIARNIWSLLLKSGSLWVAWCHSYLLRERSIWSVSIPHDQLELEENFEIKKHGLGLFGAW